MNKYRKKPVVIEAVQLTPNNRTEVFHWITDTEVEEEDDGLLITTLEGDHLCKYGNYVIKGIAGEFYSCDPDIFQKTYEPVDPQEIAKLAGEVY